MNSHEPTSFAGVRVLVMGLGRHGGGVAVTRWLAEQGAVVSVTDTAPREALLASIEQLADLAELNYRFGSHNPADFLQTDILVVNPAVKLSHPLVELARLRGAMITSETELFLRHNLGRIVAITGTAGKSTTASMLAAICRAAGRRTFLGGNIGHSLLIDLARIRSGDLVVMELSSFQLAWLGDSVPSPELGIITNCTPNHLDWHGNWDSYRSAKQRMLRGPFAARKSILSSDDNTTSEWNRIARERLIDVRELPTELKLPQPGKHLRQNARLAFTAAHYLGVADEFAIDVLERFTGLPHRMESIGEVSGRQFVNDSKATSAAATMAALHAFDRPVWLLAGGVYGGERLDELAQTIVTKAAGAVFFGKSGEQLAAACLAAQPNFRQQTVASLAAAVPVAWQWSSVGDTILLSPACASFDQFADFAARGQAFGEIVDRLACSAGGDVTRQKLLH